MSVGAFEMMLGLTIGMNLRHNTHHQQFQLLMYRWVHAHAATVMIVS